MIRRLMVGAVALLAGSAVAAAAAKDDVSGAVKKLGDNYSWKTTSENAGGGGGGGGGRGGNFGPAEGKTADGLVLMSFSGRNGNTTEILRKGEKVVIKTDAGWKTPEEMQAENANNNAGGGGRRGGRGGPGGMARGARLPAVLAEDLATKASDLEKSGDAYSGTLSEEAVKELLSPPRRGGGGGGNAPEISKAKGTVKFWLKDGALSKYEYNVQGTMTMANGNEREINRTTTVELSEVGSTKIDVPDEAKKKLES